MKKTIFILSAVLLMAAGSFAQRVTMANYADTLSGAQTKYYAAAVQADLYYGGFQIYVDHITGSTDSTHVWIQGSVDGTNYLNVGSVTVNARTLATDNYLENSFGIRCFYTTDASFIWYYTTPLPLPYYRFAVQHYATGTVRVKGYLFKKK